MQDDNTPKPGDNVTPGKPEQTELEAGQASAPNNEQPQAAGVPPTPEDPEASSEWAFTGEGADQPTTDIATIEWTASEYIAHEKSPTWFAASAAGGAVVAALIYFITGELLASITIIIVAFAAMFYSARRPEIRRYKLSTNGLAIDDKSYPMSEFRSFSVVREGAIESIWLETLSKLTPTIRLYFAPEDGQAITDALSQVLPYQQRELDAVERASRRIRF